MDYTKFTLEDLIDLKSAREANEELARERELEAQAKLQDPDNLPGQIVFFVNGEGDYPIEDDFPY